MGADDDLDGKTTHFYWFLHANNKGTKTNDSGFVVDQQLKIDK